MQEFDYFHSINMVRQIQKTKKQKKNKKQKTKTQLKLYLYEPRVDMNAKLDILAFWKGNEFQYPKLAAMSHNDVSQRFEHSCFYCCFRMYI